VVVPYSKNHVVARPLAFTVPLSVADVGATELAPPVDACGAAEVARSPSAPRDVPALLVATTR
jgi:hypothetical protein